MLELAPGRFQILEDGASVEADEICVSSDPTAVVLAIDTSGSMLTRMPSGDRTLDFETFRWDTTGLPPGGPTVQVEVIDTYGRSGVAEAIYQVDASSSNGIVPPIAVFVLAGLALIGYWFYRSQAGKTLHPERRVRRCPRGAAYRRPGPRAHSGPEARFSLPCNTLPGPATRPWSLFRGEREKTTTPSRGTDRSTKTEPKIRRTVRFRENNR